MAGSCSAIVIPRVRIFRGARNADIWAVRIVGAGELAARGAVGFLLRRTLIIENVIFYEVKDLIGFKNKILFMKHVKIVSFLMFTAVIYLYRSQQLLVEIVQRL